MNPTMVDTLARAIASTATTKALAVLVTGINCVLLLFTATPNHTISITATAIALTVTASASLNPYGNGTENITPEQTLRETKRIMAANAALLCLLAIGALSLA